MSGGESYFVITASADGINVHVMSKEQLEDVIEKEGSGYDDVEWSNGIPDSDPNCWSGKGVIIKGSIVQPAPVEVVKKWELP